MRGLSITFAVVLGAGGGAASGLLGPILFNEAFGVRLSPEWRLPAGAVGCVVCPVVAGAAAGRRLNRDRPAPRTLKSPLDREAS